MALTTARPLLGHHRCLGGLTAVTVVKHYRRVEAACISLLFFFMTLGLVVSSQQSGHRSVSPIKASKKKQRKRNTPLNQTARILSWLLRLLLAAVLSFDVKSRVPSSLMELLLAQHLGGDNNVVKGAVRLSFFKGVGVEIRAVRT